MNESFSLFDRAPAPERRSADLLKDFYHDASDRAVAILNNGIIAPHVSLEERLTSIALFNEMGEAQLKKPLQVEEAKGSDTITIPNEMRLTVSRKSNGQIVLTPSEVASVRSTVDAAGPEEYHEVDEDLKEAA